MRALKLFVLAFALVLAACASAPRTVGISRAQIEAALARRFPIETRAGELFAVRVTQPRLTLLPDANRIRLDVDMEATNRVAHSAVRGQLAMSFGLRWEASDASVRLADVRTEAFELQGLPEALARQLRPVGAAVAERLLDDRVLRRFRPEELARAQGWTPGAIRVTPSGIVVELLPPAR